MKTYREKRAAPYYLLLVLSMLFTLAAGLTLMPNAGASWENVLGYRSLCTFAPIATAICALLAGTCCVIRARLFKPGSSRRSWRAPLVALALCLTVIAVSVPAYLRAKADAQSGASVAVE